MLSFLSIIYFLIVPRKLYTRFLVTFQSARFKGETSRCKWFAFTLSFIKLLIICCESRDLICQITGHYVYPLASGNVPKLCAILWLKRLTLTADLHYFLTGVGAGCGWFVSYRVITSCHRDLSLEGTVDGKINQLPG